MSAQDLEQRARELLPELPPCVDAYARAAWGPKPDYYTADQMHDYAAGAIVAALRQQPAPVVDGATVSALQSTRDRMMAALTPKFGDAFDGDFDVMLEAINTLKRLRAALARAQGVQS